MKTTSDVSISPTVWTAIRKIQIATSVALSVAVCFSLGLCASAQHSSSHGIVGRWFSLERSKGGIGQVCEFQSNGAVNFSVGAVVEMPWRVENSHLIFPPATTDGPEQEYLLKWLGKNKLILQTKGVVTELDRVGNQPDSNIPIVGEWIEHREMGGRKVEARYLFYARGEVLLIIPFTNQHGSYTTSGSALQIEVPGSTKRDFRFKVAGDYLTLSDPDGGEDSHFARY